MLRDAVESGAYASRSEVIREAMRDWSAKWQQRRGDIQKMRGFWAEDKASSPATLVDFDEVLEEARQELEIVRTPGRLVQTPRKSISKLARSSRWLPNDFSCSSCYKANLLAGHPRLDERYPEIFRTARMLVEAPISSPMKHFISRHGRKRNPYD